MAGVMVWLQKTGLQVIRILAVQAGLRNEFGLSLGCNNEKRSKHWGFGLQWRQRRD